MTRVDVIAIFEHIEPDGADVMLDVALGNPFAHSWSYVLGGSWHTCRGWSEVVDVARNLRDACAEVAP